MSSSAQPVLVTRSDQRARNVTRMDNADASRESQDNIAIDVQLDTTTLVPMAASEC